MNKLLVLITNATGQQGGALAKQLLERGHTVRTLTRKPESEKAKQLLKLGAELIEGNFDNPNFESKFRMEDWFNRVGYSADIEGLHRDYPTLGWTRFREWAGAQDWSVLN